MERTEGGDLSAALGLGLVPEASVVAGLRCKDMCVPGFPLWGPLRWTISVVLASERSRPSQSPPAKGPVTGL